MSQTLSGMFLVGAALINRERGKGQIEKKKPEQNREIPKKKTNWDGRVQIGKTPRLKTPLPVSRPLKSQEMIAICFFERERFTTQGPKLRGFPLGTLLPKTRVLERRVLESKRKPNANASVNAAF